MSVTKLITTATICLESAKKNSTYYGNLAIGYKAALRHMGYEDLDENTPGPVGEILAELKKSADYNQSRHNASCHEIEALETVLQEAQKAHTQEAAPTCGITEVEESVLDTEVNKAAVAEYGSDKFKGVHTVWINTKGVSLSECAKWYEAELARQDVW